MRGLNKENASYVAALDRVLSAQMGRPAKLEDKMPKFARAIGFDGTADEFVAMFRKDWLRVQAGDDEGSIVVRITGQGQAALLREPCDG